MKDTVKRIRLIGLPCSQLPTGRASVAIFQRANTAWVSSATFAQGEVVRVAHDLSTHWVQTLRPHLLVVHSQGNQHRLVYPSYERIFQTELEKAIFHALLVGAHLRQAGGYDLTWSASQTEFDSSKMVAEHEENGDKVFLTVFPGMRRTTKGRAEVVCKARVVCTCPERLSKNRQRQGSVLEADTGDGDCITVTRKR